VHGCGRHESARCDHVGILTNQIGAKIAQAAAMRRSSNIAIRQRRWRRVYNRKPFSFSSETFAGMRITHRHQKEAYSTLSNQSENRAPIRSLRGSPPGCTAPAFLGSFGWELQQLISQFVVAGVALCHIF
jgi:hypothetical protein